MSALFPHLSDHSNKQGATVATIDSLTDRMSKAQETAAKALTVRYSVMFELTAHLSMTETLRVIRDFARNASISEVIGFSAGEKEDSIIVDVIAGPAAKADILDMARMLKVLHHQRSVLVSWSTVSTIVI